MCCREVSQRVHVLFQGKKVLRGWSGSGSISRSGSVSTAACSDSKTGAEHPHGLSDAEYDMLFTKDKPIIFAFHGYPTLVHELTYRRHNRNLHVRGYREEGTITTPFDMRVQNDIDRFHLVKDVLLRLPQLGNRGAYLYQKMSDKLVQHQQYITEYGEDMPEVREWKWK